jgi:KDO2-lipid IV(A) lauroyltransferase
VSGQREDKLQRMRAWKLTMPRWWPTWAGVALLRLSALLPLRVTRAAGRTMGMALYAGSRERRRITRVNLRLCFPQIGDRERERLVRHHFAMLGESMFEMAYGWWAPEARLRELGKLSGQEHLDAALARGKGVILLQGHFLTTDIAGQILGTQLPFVATFARPKNPVARFLLESLRGRFIRRQIHHTELRPILRALADNEIVWHGPDQGRRRGSKVDATFFGQPASTSLATAKLARVSGAAVVPYHPLRRADGTYELRIQPALEEFPGDELAAATQRVNEVIEAQVRVAPEQYLWCHRRFKPARDDDPDPYR